MAHEWFHALDHYLATKAFETNSPSKFASDCWLNNVTPILHPINERLHQVFKSIFLDTCGDEASELFLNSKKTDLSLGTLYYARPEEMAARAFEAFVEDTGPQNAFLARGSRNSEEAKAGLYPKGQQRERINQAFAGYFSALRQALR